MWQRYALVRQNDQSDCGAAALATVALHYRRPIGLQQMRDLAGTDRIGTNLLGLLQAAEKLGFSAKGVKGPYEALSQVPLPAIAHVRTAEGLDTVITAHTDDVVTSGEVKVGDTLEAGKAVLAIAQERGFRVDVAVPAAEIGHVRESMAVQVKLDAYDYQRYGTVNGAVYHISPDSQKLEGQQAVIYVVKVTLEGDEVGRGEYRGQVKLGMTGQAEIVTGQESVLSLLVKKVRQTISLG
jgi:hypothetical protein